VARHREYPHYSSAQASQKGRRHPRVSTRFDDHIVDAGVKRSPSAQIVATTPVDDIPVRAHVKDSYHNNGEPSPRGALNVRGFIMHRAGSGERSRCECRDRTDPAAHRAVRGGLSAPRQPRRGACRRHSGCQVNPPPLEPGPSAPCQLERHTSRRASSRRNSGASLRSRARPQGNERNRGQAHRARLAPRAQLTAGSASTGGNRLLPCRILVAAARARNSAGMRRALGRPPGRGGDGNR